MKFFEWCSVPVSNPSASPAHQFALDVSGNPDRLDVVMEPPACQLHLWRPEAGLVTHTSYIGDYGEPRPAS